MIDKYNAFIFDLDGTIYRGTKLISNACLTINKLRQTRKKIIFISNKTTEPISYYYNFLLKNGVEVDKNEIINSTLVLGKYLKENFLGKKFFALGEKSFINEIEDFGLIYSQVPPEINLVLVTLDRTLNFDKLEIAARAIENGAKFFAANIDDTCPIENGEVLDAGTTITVLEKRTHKKLELHFGKPSKFMMNEIRNRFDMINDRILLIGDRLETDILMGNLLGIDTALVSTGVTNYPNGNANIQPTFYLNSIYDLIK